MEISNIGVSGLTACHYQARSSAASFCFSDPLAVRNPLAGAPTQQKKKYHEAMRNRHH
jgi:hypothetical protein